MANGQLFLVGIGFVLLTQSVVSGQSCGSAVNCSHCLDISASCSWCSDPDIVKFPTPSSRCNSAFSGGCTTVVKLNSSQQVVDKPSFSETVQVTPSAFSVTLSPHNTVELRVSVKPAQNFPLDLYYLMDHSASMGDDLDTLKIQAVNLALAIKNISNNYQIGYGTYVDKPALPMMLTQDLKLLSQCITACKWAYSFQNNFNLSRDVSAFQTAVKKDKVSSNWDVPEGTADAMMQAAVCSQIGWREKARRILLVVTDAVLHSAGAGKLAGIIRANDGKCYLNSTGFYTNALGMDYPSIGFLRYIFQRENILPIFSVTEDVFPIYDEIRKVMANTGAVALPLSKNSSNIVELLQEELARQVSKAKIIAISPGGLKFNITAQCPENSFNRTDNFDICNKMNSGQAANYSIRITAGNCNEIRKLSNVTIRFPGFGDVAININPVCDCPCKNAPARNDPHCTGQGTNTCGLCSCNKGFSGDVCDCDENPALCRNGTGAVCNDRGTCRCGKCTCNTELSSGKMISGQFCQCDNFNCPKDDQGTLCGGQGSCNCSTCICSAGYIGESCSCPLSNEGCRAPVQGGTVCSSEGRCKCGKCTCYGGFGGTFCDICENKTQCLSSGQCARSKICLTCDDITKCPQCSGTVNVAPQSGRYQISGTLAKRCPAQTSGKCDHWYWVAVNEQADGDVQQFYQLHVQPKTNCPESFNYLPIVLGIVLGLVFVGVLLLVIYRLIIEYQYREEFKRFEESRTKQKWEETTNPIFKSNVQTVKNPQYGQA